MKWSELFIPTLKETPKEATIQSHILMLRAGLMIKQGSGIYGYLPLGLKILNKIEQIIDEEISATGAQRVFLPHLVQRELWDLTGRYSKMGKGIFTLKDRHNNDFLLGPTHEESMVDMLKGFVSSYKQLPLNFFQITKKFRDEIRPRYGVMRGKEFTMMDGYSFHTSTESLDEYYQRYKRAYRRIFARIGLKTVPVSADSGDMGGEGSEEFMVPSHIGDDTILSCNQCAYVANQEKATFFEPPIDFADMEEKEIETPNIKTIATLAEFCKASEKQTAKTRILKAKKLGWIVAIVRGDREVNEVKLQNLLKGDTFLDITNEDIEAEIGPIGFLGPKNLNRENITLVLDSLLQDQKNMIVGMNKLGWHYQGYSFEGLNPDITGDISMAEDGDYCPDCKVGQLQSFAGIEVGHIFKLGDDYSRKMDLKVLDQTGKPKNPLMGCYGIGVDRNFAAVIEQNNDSEGMILPLSISPFAVLVTPIGEEHQELGDKVYLEIQKNYNVLLDNRDVSAGIKLKEADLLGIPIRITIGKKYKEEGLFGVKIRSQKEEQFLLPEKIKEYIDQYIQEQKHIEEEKLKEIDLL